MACEEVQRVVFPRTRESGVEKGDGSGSAQDASPEEAEGEDDDDGGVRLPSDMVPPPATTTSPTTNRLKKSTLSPDPPLTPQQQGLQIAKQREQVRRAARRGVAFGFRVDCDGGDDGGKARARRRVEAVQDARLVEASFAKGGWGVRWRL